MNFARSVFVLCLSLCASSAFADTTVGQSIDDTAVEAKVKVRLLEKNFLHGANINIETRKGVVQLGGFIDNEAEGKEAAETAAAVAGVKSVDNQLHVKEGEATMGQMVDDRVITSSVKRKLIQLTLATGISVNVDTHAGVVLLTGFVDDEETKAKAGELAEGTDNVKKVINGINVLP